MKRLMLAVTVSAAVASLVLHSIADTTGGIDNPPTLVVHADIPNVPVEQYARVSVDLIDAVVTDVKPAYSKEGIGCTEYTLSVSATLKGKAGGTQRLLVGGSPDTWPPVHVEGAPTIQKGERIIAFVCGSPGSEIFLLGLSQGLYRVQSEGEHVTIAGPHANGDTTPDEFFEAIEQLL